MQKLVVIGGGEFARVVIEAALATRQWSVVGFVDPKPCEETVQRLNVQRLGDDSVLYSLTDEMLVLGIGSVKVSSVRERIVAQLNSLDRWARIVHPYTSISPTAHIAPGTVVLPGAVICSGAVISQHAIVNIGAKVDHDACIEKFVHLAPQVAIGGGALIQENCYVGLGAVVRDHLTVSAKTTVGMGAVVNKQFMPGQTLIGVPARPMGLASC